MKKILSAAILFLLVFLTSCELPEFGSSTPNKDKTAEKTNEVVTTPTKDVEKTPTKEVEKTPTPVSSKDVYYLDSKDYVKTLDGSDAYARYNELDKKVKGEVNGIYQESYKSGLKQLFDIQNKLTIVIDISSSSLEELNNYQLTSNKESYALCNVDITYLNITVHYENVGIRQKGNMSRGEILTEDSKIELRHYKLCFSETFDDEFRTKKVNFTEEYKTYLDKRDLFGLEKLDIRWNRNEDETYLREYYAYEMYRANGLLAAHSNLCNVKFNVDGKDMQNLGVYLAVEPIDKDFLKRNLVKDSQGGDLYKLGWGSGKQATFSSVSDKYFGVETQYKNNDGFYQKSYTYDLKTNKDTSTHQAIKTFINKITSTNVANFDTMLKEYSEYDDFIGYLACAFMCSDPDDLRANGNNTYVYFTPEGKAIFIPTDNDRSFGSTGGSKPIVDYGTDLELFAFTTGYLGYNDSPLFAKTVQYEGNSTVQNDYKTRLRAILDNDSFKYSTFKACYDKAYSNYMNDLNLGSKVNHETIAFNEGSVTVFDGDWNLKTSKFFELKRSSVERQTEPEDEYIMYVTGSFNNNQLESDYIISTLKGVGLDLKAGDTFCIRCTINGELDEDIAGYSYLDSSIKSDYDNVNEYIKVKKDGKYVILLNEDYINIVYVDTSFSTSIVYYFRGTNNGWGATDDYKILAANGYSITVELEALAEFKIADSNWSHQYNIENVVDTTCCQKGSGTNISVLYKGTYRITIISDSQITVEKIA